LPPQNREHMRFLISVFIAFLFFTGCTSKTENLTLSGTVKGLKKGTLYLQKFEDTLLISVDSVHIDGKSDFVFREQLDEPEIYYLYVQLKDASLQDDLITFFAEEGTMTIHTVIDEFGNRARITGSKNDSILRVYDKLKQRFITRNLELIEERLKLKSGSPDSLKIAIELQQQRLLSNKYYTTVNFAINHKDFEVAPYLVLSEAAEVQVKYLDTVYNVLPQKIKDSKYGRELESFIQFRRENDSLEFVNSID